MNIAPKDDPHLRRLQLENQLRLHIGEENRVHQAYKNSERSGRLLEQGIVKIVANCFNIYHGMLVREAECITDLAQGVRSSADMTPLNEWEEFLKRDKVLVDPSIPMRNVEDISYKGDNQLTEIRSGYLERKSKFLRSYSRGYYFLTSAGYMHEFKSKDSTSREPTVSLFLPNCQLGDHSTEDQKSHKFVLRGAQAGGNHSVHSWVFRAPSHAEMLQWYNDIRVLTQLGSMTKEEKGSLFSHYAHDSGKFYGREPLDAYIDDDELMSDEGDHISFAQVESTASTTKGQDEPTEWGAFATDGSVQEGDTEYGARKRSETTESKQQEQYVAEPLDLQNPASPNDSVYGGNEYQRFPKGKKAIVDDEAGHVSQPDYQDYNDVKQDLTNEVSSSNKSIEN